MTIPSTMDITIPRHLKTFIYGDWGSGKTWTVGTAPKPLYVFDCDNGIQTLSGVPDIYYDVYDEPQDLKDFTPLNEFIEQANKFAEQDVPTYEGTEINSIAVDSSTTLAKLCKNRIITLNKNWSNDNKMRIQDWGVLADDLSEIFAVLQSINANIIITGHNRIAQNEETKSVLYLVMSEAGQSFPQSAPRHFDEIYRMVVRKRPGKRSNEYKLQTESDPKWAAKSRLNYYDHEEGNKVRVLDKYEDNNLDQIVEKVHKAREEAKRQVKIGRKSS